MIAACVVLGIVAIHLLIWHVGVTWIMIPIAAIIGLLCRAAYKEGYRNGSCEVVRQWQDDRASNG